MDFTGRLALVTGGASGIGLACAERLALGGARLAIADRNAEAVAALARERGWHGLVMDVGDEHSVADGLDRLAGEAGGPDLLVHAAGILQRALPPGELTMKEWDLVQTVDLRGTYLLASRVGVGMAARGHGAIVCIASIAGMTSGPLASYGPAKAAVISLVQILAAEWGGRGVRVNAVSPGFTATPALQKGIDKGSLAVADMSGCTALGRLVEPREVAAAVCFLLGEEASAITGINLPVDAGYLAGTTWQAYGGLRGRS